MRKIREKELKIDGSIYIFNNGISTKTKANDLYPIL
jgi:hypothetical protein